jgi:hypothetical protein
MHWKGKRVTDMSRQPGITIVLLLIAGSIIFVIPGSAADDPSDNALTRGSRFSVNITGSPSTPYYVWLTRTSSMTGEPGDQPPVIVAFQSGIQLDPTEGPYTIGSYEFSSGNGRTIRDDVAPSTPEMSNTGYYALVTTDTDGRAVVTFQTSSATATRTFSIKVENPSSPANSDVLIERGLPLRIPTVPLPTPRKITQEPTAPPEVTLPESPSPSPVVLTTEPVPVPIPSQKSPPGYGYCFIAIMAGLFVWRRMEI